MPPATYDLSSYGVEHFGGASLGDARRDKSLIDAANRICSRDKQTQDLPATEVVSQEEMEVLSGRYHKKHRALTVREFFLLLARLGGYQNRKKDHPPGWLVLCCGVAGKHCN
jgi:hypothetical protein